MTQDKVEEVKRLIREMTMEERKEIKKWCKDYDFHIM